MKIALIQQSAGPDKRANVERGLAALARAARAGATVVSFAELGFEIFHPQRPAAANPLDLAETVPGPTTDAFSKAAREFGVVVVINLYERDGGRAFDCSPAGGNAVTHLAGPYVKVADVCGNVTQTVACDDDLDLGQGPGTDCAGRMPTSSGSTRARPGTATSRRSRRTATTRPRFA